MFRIINSVWRHTENTLIVSVLVVMLGLVVAQVILRNLFGAGVDWAEQALQYALLWLAFLGAGIASRERRHISIDALLGLFPKPLRRGLGVITSLFAAAVCFFVAWWCWQLVLFERESGEIAFANMPVWICVLVMPVSFAVMGIRAVADIFIPVSGEAQG